MHKKLSPRYTTKLNHRLFSSSSSSTSTSTFHVPCCVIGGGVVGLAVATRLSQEVYTDRDGPTVLLERQPRLGEETSSRNSEVIHAGIYYPSSSLKTRSCIYGNAMLYRVCQEYNIPHRNIGKWIVAQNDDEAEFLDTLHSKANTELTAILDSSHHGPSLRYIPHYQVQQEEPLLRASHVLESQTTGIVDSHRLMQFLEQRFTGAGGIISTQSNVIGIDQVETKADGEGYWIHVEDPPFTLRADAVVNAAGLYADEIAKMVLGDDFPEQEYRQYLAKGVYLGYRGLTPFQRLIYPVPERNLQGLGVHSTLDMSDQTRFGPNVQYLEDKDSDPCLQSKNHLYSVPNGTKEEKELIDQFHSQIHRYFPSVSRSKLFADYAGVRPKLSPPGGGFRDFVVQEESARGLNNWVNMLGIESPGLTASLFLADLVAQKLGHKSRLDWI